MLWEVVEEVIIQLVCVAFVAVLLEVRPEELELASLMLVYHIVKMHQMRIGETDMVLGVLVMLDVQLAVTGVDEALPEGGGGGG
jgi:hypothetical protein